jgi:dihydrofolate reductase
MSHSQPLAMIVAASENNVIGNDGALPWRLSADLKRFKKLTMGHHIIMGRKTFDSIGVLLPGRQTVIITRQEDYQFEGAIVAHSIDQAIDHAVENGDLLPFIVGGAEIYRLAMPRVTEIYLTRVHADIEGDTRLPETDGSGWEQTENERHQADERNEFEYTFERWVRKS